MSCLLFDRLILRFLYFSMLAKSTEPLDLLKAFVFKGSPLTTADLGSCLNFILLASWAKFKKEPNLLQPKVTL